LQCYLVIADDTVDTSETRNGFPCWYRYEGVGMRAIVDGQILGNSVYVLLKRHFSNHNCYASLIQLFREAAFQVTVGQIIDMLAVSKGKPQFNNFTMDMFKATASNKSAYAFFILPNIATMYLAEIYDEQLYRDTKSILFRLGEYLQVQNDMSDCYGNPEATGKKGNDIMHGKNTWLIGKALQNATKVQRRIIEEHYGKTELESQQKILAIYDSLHLLDYYLQYEEETYHQICEDVLKLPNKSLSNYLLNLTDIVFVRDTNNNSLSH
ncbi:hypothetical protein ILUMI_12896, partial [Ignelater luminosus]